MDNLLEILASPQQVGILIGAGVSKACGLPNVEDLSIEVRKIIVDKNFVELLSDKDNVEVILNKLQQLKPLLVDGKKFNNLSLIDIQKIEKDIKKTIYETLSRPVDFIKLCSLVTWLNFINREFEKEIFTLNYDLLLEKAIEELSLPYFTGFIGNVKPFFISDSVDDYQGIYVKKSWTKLWKLHGSLNFKKTPEGKIFIENNIGGEFENLLVYPSMDKYLSSRKAPFISYLDRFRRYMLENEKVLLVLGYSFSDEHINEIIINGLNNNTRLSVFAFAFDEKTYQNGIKLLGIYPNASIYTEKKKFINRAECEFEYGSNIGDFNNLVKILDSLISQKHTSIRDEKSE